MATIDVPRRICDRAGCGAVVTEKGGRFALQAHGPENMVGQYEGNEARLGQPERATVRWCSVDLCRACAESLRTWWSSKEARAATKAVGK